MWTYLCIVSARWSRRSGWCNIREGSNEHYRKFKREKVGYAKKC